MLEEKAESCNLSAKHPIKSLAFYIIISVDLLNNKVVNLEQKFENENNINL